jgi:hypothetical protein
MSPNSAQEIIAIKMRGLTLSVKLPNQASQKDIA